MRAESFLVAARRCRSSGRRIPESPGEERAGVAPDPVVAVTEHNHDDVFAWPRTARDQTFPGGFGITSFHPIAVGQALQKFVGVFEFAGASIRETKNKLRQAN